MNFVTRKVNAYFAILMITIIGSGAALLITHIANANTYTIFQYENVQQAALGV